MVLSNVIVDVTIWPYLIIIIIVMIVIIIIYYNNNYNGNNKANYKILFTINFALKILFIQSTIYNSFRLKNHLVSIKKLFE